MPQQLDVDRDPFLLLLTDALRAGPGSPQWHEAVAQLKTSGEAVDEYKLLLEAREALENGKDYRSVRAGPGFTRKLNDQLDQQRTGAPRIRVASLIAILASIALIAAIAFGVYRFYPRAPADDTVRQIAELASTYIPTELNSTTFDNGIPASWKTIGSLPLDTAAGLKAGLTSAPAGDYVGGGIVLINPAPAAQPVAVLAVLKVNKSGPDLIPQIFISTDSGFTSDRAVSAHENSHELVWQLKGDVQDVVVNGSVTRQTGINLKSPTHTIRLTLKGDLAIVECDGRRLWAGHSTLADQPRHIGVRFLRTGSSASGDASFQSIKVLTTQEK